MAKKQSYSTPYSGSPFQAMGDAVRSLPPFFPPRQRQPVLNGLRDSNQMQMQMDAALLPTHPPYQEMRAQWQLPPSGNPADMSVEGWQAMRQAGQQALQNNPFSQAGKLLAGVGRSLSKPQGNPWAPGQNPADQSEEAWLAQRAAAQQALQNNPFSQAAGMLGQAGKSLSGNGGSSYPAQQPRPPHEVPLQMPSFPPLQNAMGMVGRAVQNMSNGGNGQQDIRLPAETWKQGPAAQQQPPSLLGQADQNPVQMPSFPPLQDAASMIGRAAQGLGGGRAPQAPQGGGGYRPFPQDSVGHMNLVLGNQGNRASEADLYGMAQALGAKVPPPFEMVQGQQRPQQQAGPMGPFGAEHTARMNEMFPNMPVGMAPPPKEYQHGPGGMRDHQRAMMQSPYGGGGGNYVPPTQMPSPGYMEEGAALGQGEAAMMRHYKAQGNRLLPQGMEDEFNGSANAALEARGFPIGQGPGGQPQMAAIGQNPGGQMRMIDDGQGGQTVMPRAGAVMGQYSDEQRQEMAGRREQFRKFRNEQAQMAMEALARRPAEARAMRTADAKKAKMQRQMRLGKIPPSDNMQMAQLQQMALNGNPAALQMMQGLMRNNQVDAQRQHEIGRDDARFEHERGLVGAREKAEQDRVANSPQGQADALALKKAKEEELASRNSARTAAADALKNEKPVEVATYLSQFEGPELIDEARQLGLTPEKLVQMMRQDQFIGIGGMGRSIAGFFTNPSAQAGIDSQRQAEAGSAYRRRTYERPEDRDALSNLLERLRQAHTSQPGFNGTS